MFLFGDMRRKKEIDSPIIFEYTPTICIVCNSKMDVIGSRPIYEGMCWNCFKKKVIALTLNTSSIEDSALILHLLDIARIHHKGPDGRF